MTMVPSLFTLAGMGFVWLALGGHADGGLINHWKFDESSGSTAIDSGSSPLDLSLQGDAQFVADGTRGQVLELDGNGDYANNSSEPFTSDINHTVAGWVNHFDSGNLTQRWISWGASSGGRYFLGPLTNTANSNSGKIHWGFGTASAFYADTAAKPLEDTWQHWAFVREGTAARFYLNGVLVESLVVPVSGSITTSGELRIGRQFGSNLEYLHGRIDDLAIWDAALEPWQINNAMNFGAENYLAPEPSTLVLLVSTTLGMLVVRRFRRRLAPN